MLGVKATNGKALQSLPSLKAFVTVSLISSEWCLPGRDKVGQFQPAHFSTFGGASRGGGGWAGPEFLGSRAPVSLSQSINQ